MKRKYVAILLTAMLCSVPFSGWSVQAEETENTQEDISDTEEAEAASEEENTGENTEMPQRMEIEEDAVYGEVVSVSENSVTINVGTLAENGEEPSEDTNSQTESSSEGASQEEDQDSAAAQEPAEGENPSEGEEPSMLELSGEQQEIGITENTVFTRINMGQPGGQGGETPEMPEGEEGEAPEMPGGEGGEAPEMPEGEDGEVPEMPEGEDGEAPEMPEGENGEAPEMPEGENPDADLTWEDIQEGDTIAAVVDADGNAETIYLLSGNMGQPGGGQMGGGAQAVDSYDAAVSYTEDTETDGETYASSETDENAILVSEEAEITIKNASITRSSSDSTGGDTSSFYGVGAALLTTSGSAYISDSTIETDAAGGAGLFAYGEGTVYAADTTISTALDTSGGIHAAGGGTFYAWNLTVDTQGESSAAIRSDRGGGTMVIDGGSYTSNGIGSPAVYCTADIAVNGAGLTANGSEAVCIEGLNSLHLYDCQLTGNMGADERNDCTWNVILYQSMSGDSQVGNSTFEMSGGTLTAENGGMFYTTNTESTITLSNVEIQYSADNPFFLQCTGNNNQRGWGNSGANGADCLFTALSQEMQGDIIWDSISNLDLYLTEGSILEGAVRNDETWAGEGGDGYCSVYISEDSTWRVTGDSTLTNLYCAGSIVDENGETVTVAGTDGTVYTEGTSSYTITVENYEASEDISGAPRISQFSQYETEMPKQLI